MDGVDVVGGGSLGVGVLGGWVGVDVAGCDGVDVVCAGGCEFVAGGLFGLLFVPAALLVGVLSAAGDVVCVSDKSDAVGSVVLSGSTVEVLDVSISVV